MSSNNIQKNMLHKKLQYTLGLVFLLTLEMQVYAADINPAFTTPVEQARQEQLEAQERLRQQERERSLRQQQEIKPDVRDDVKALSQIPPASDVIPDNETPCFVIHKIELAGDAAEKFQFALEDVLKRGRNPDDRADNISILGSCLGVLGVKMMAETGNKSKGDFMSTHPSPPNRIEAFQALQEPMQKIYEERAPLYADYKPTYQYVRTAKGAAGFSSSNVRVITEGSALVEAPAVDATQAMAFYSPNYELFKQGTLELTCKNCSLKFYLNQSDFKSLYEKQDWRGLAQSIIKVGYEFDLAYYYLGAAAKGLALAEPSRIYFRKAKALSGIADSSCANAKMIKCNDVDIAAAAE